jgi:hypothetical protein
MTLSQAPSRFIKIRDLITISNCQNRKIPAIREAMHMIVSEMVLTDEEMQIDFARKLIQNFGPRTDRETNVTNRNILTFLISFSVDKNHSLCRSTFRQP